MRHENIYTPLTAALSQMHQSIGIYFSVVVHRLDVPVVVRKRLVPPLTIIVVLEDTAHAAYANTFDNNSNDSDSVMTIKK